MDIAKMLLGTKLNTLSNKALYLQIAELIAKKINTGILPAGAKLLPERDLANLFNVSRTTAINAYRMLERQDLVTTKVGSGTFVAGSKTPIAEEGIPWLQLFKSHSQSTASDILREMVSDSPFRDVISFVTGMPDPAFYPVETFADLFNKYMDSFKKTDLGYISSEGYEPLRGSISEMLKAEGIPSKAEEIMVVSGAQQGLYLLSKALLEPGDYVVMESPTFLGAIQAFQSAGAKILSIDTSNYNFLSILEDYLIRYRPKLLYIMPTFQNPSGNSMSLKARQDLLALAARHRLVIAEDNPYKDLYYGQLPPPSLKALDSFGGVVYLGTFSKVLTPGLRVGYISADPQLIKRLAFDKQYVDLNTNIISQWLLQKYLEEGNLKNHLAFVRGQYKKRRNEMAKALNRFCENEIDFAIPDGGYYIWCRIRGGGTTGKLLHESIKNGVSFAPGDAFYNSPGQNKEFRLCFVTHDERTIIEGIRRLGKTLGILRKTKKEVHNSAITGPPII